MILPYSLRLACLCLAAFFVVHLAAGLLISVVSRMLARAAEPLKPRTAATVLFSLRLLPCALGLMTVAVLCVPSYLWLEPDQAGESVSVAGIAAAILSASLWGSALMRATRAAIRSWKWGRYCDRICRPAPAMGTVPVLVVDTAAPILGISGLVSPRMVISQGVLGALSEPQMQAALRHEMAHRQSGDNWKRLAMLATPDLFPGVPAYRELETAWARMTEWAADDEAAAGDPRRRLDLAEALVRVAGLGEPARPVALMTSLLAERRDLAVRVQRLLDGGEDTRERAGMLMLGGCSAVLASSACLLLSHSDVLRDVHTLLERLTH